MTLTISSARIRALACADPRPTFYPVTAGGGGVIATGGGVVTGHGPVIIDGVEVGAFSVARTSEAHPEIRTTTVNTRARIASDTA